MIAWLVGSLWVIYGLYLAAEKLFGKNQSSSIAIKEDAEEQSTAENSEKRKISNVCIAYATQTGNSKSFAKRIHKHLKTELQKHGESVDVLRIDKLDVDSFSSKKTIANEQLVHVFVLPTYTEGQPTEDARQFYDWLNEWIFDYRVDNDALSHINFCVMGLGDSAFTASGCYNTVGRNVDKWLAALGGKRINELTLCDVSNDLESGFEQGLQSLHRLVTEGWVPVVLDQDKNRGFDNSDTESEEEEEDEANFDIEGAGSDADGVMDVEDLGKIAGKLQEAVSVNRRSVAKLQNKSAAKVDLDGQPIDVSEQPAEPAKSMLNPTLEKSLKKQGYKLIGSHSGVKVCRWTKSMLRGRGGCYKHTFYGIASHQCMETTPSLACANKCVFCWRHHTNPVGTEWKWKIDPPQMILDGAMSNHYNMINMFKGVPGVKPERFAEGMNVRHCALSLVGEPIMYPHINEFIDMLHERNISSFLVTNAQFPEKILELKPVTQLYVSVDAPTKQSLKKIDRPLFQDFWERFLACLDALGTKGQRTVYRMTLVKDFNTEDIEKYAQLVKRGRPDFIEIKGVTFCGYSGSNPLTMANVPYQHEVVSFVEKFLGYLDNNYAISCEHAHSCSVLIADKKFLINDKWHTWIDYDKFQDLVASGEQFDSMEYIAPTPEWAIYGAEEKGFDPEETRFHRKKKAVELSAEIDEEASGR